MIGWKERAVHRVVRPTPDRPDPGCSVEEKTRTCQCGWQFIRLADGHWIGPFACGTDRVMTVEEFKDLYGDCYSYLTSEAA